MTVIIVDTSAVLALFDETYAEHQPIADLIMTTADPLVISPFVVAEADYMLSTRLGDAAARRFAGDVAIEAYELAQWSAADHAEAIALMDRYRERADYLGVADAANVVLADRYRTTRLLTLDQRHFRILRPLWGADHFTVLPYDA